HVTHVISSSPCYGYVHRRDRHSVPTRRSSDLQSSGSVRRYRLRSNDTGGGRLGSQSSDELPDGEPRAHKRIEDQGSVGGIIEVPDRKSTRLNSSHQIISYAVFCLKQKT